MRVLLCDDNESFRTLARLALRQHRPDGELQVVAEAGDGREAVRLAEATRPDAVLLDLDMPVMDGETALPLIRAAAPGAQVVVVSGEPRTPALEGRLEALGARAFIGKPSDVRELAARVEEALASAV